MPIVAQTCDRREAARRYIPARAGAAWVSRKVLDKVALGAPPAPGVVATCLRISLIVEEMAHLGKEKNRL